MVSTCSRNTAHGIPTPGGGRTEGTHHLPPLLGSSNESHRELITQMFCRLMLHWHSLLFWGVLSGYDWQARAIHLSSLLLSFFRIIVGVIG